jgi:Mce-associated membrane protein
MAQMELPATQTLLNGRHAGWYRDVKLANWGWRVLAGLIDYPLLEFVVLLIAPIFTENVHTWMLITVIVWWLNSAVVQGHTGQSLGKRIFGLKVFYPKVTKDDVWVADFPGVLRSTWRLFAHVFDCLLLYLGWLRPLIHPGRQTFADSLAHTWVGKDRNLYLQRADGAYDGAIPYVG